MLRVASVSLLRGHTVHLVLNDGSIREVDLTPHLIQAGHLELLDDPALFAAARVEHGTLTWPSGQDLDPDVLLNTEVSQLGAHWTPFRPSARCAFDGVEVYIPANTPQPPRVVVVWGTEKATIGVDTGEVLDGELPAAQAKEVRAWLQEHRAEIALAWVEVQSG